MLKSVATFINDLLALAMSAKNLTEDNFFTDWNTTERFAEETKLKEMFPKLTNDNLDGILSTNAYETDIKSKTTADRANWNF